MNKKLIVGLSFAGGVIVGGGGVYIWARKWVEERINQELKEFREDMKDNSNKVDHPSPDRTDENVEKETKSKKIFKTVANRDYASYFSGPSPTEVAAAARKAFNEHMAERESPLDEDDDEEEIDPDSIDETEDERQIREEGLINIEENKLADYDPLAGIIRQTGERTYLIDEGMYGEAFSPESLVWCMVDGKLVDQADHSYYSDPYRIIGELPSGKFEDGDVIYIRNVALQFDYEIEFRNCDFDGYIDSLNP